MAIARHKIQVQLFPTNPMLRIVYVDNCPHTVSIMDGIDSRGGSSNAHVAVRRRAPWSKTCKDFISFAQNEHEIFCLR